MGVNHVSLLAVTAAGYLLHRLHRLLRGAAAKGAAASASGKAKQRAARLPKLRKHQAAPRRLPQTAGAAEPGPAEPGSEEAISPQLRPEPPAFLPPADDEMDLYDEDDVEVLQRQGDSQAQLMEMLQQ